MSCWARFAFVAAAPLFLASCLWGPGKFASDLSLKKDGSFVLDYKGEILMQLPEEKGNAVVPWNDKMARCYKDGRSVTITFEGAPAPAVEQALGADNEETRPCSAAELAKLKAQYERDAVALAERKQQENEQMAKVFGLPGSDEASNRAFAEKLKKYAGWRAVAYKGMGVFDVEYHFEGRLDQDFVFPLIPDSDLILPFIAIRRRTDGALLINAPALVGGSGPFGARAKAMGLPDKGDNGPASRAEGRFTVITDGEILTNNSEDGAAPHAAGKQVRWDVNPSSTKIPEMLVRL